MESKHDTALLEILREEKNIASFLNSFFGFLYRCTDFYVQPTKPDEKIGFPPGVAEDLVVNTLRKWKNIKRFSENPVHLPMHVDIPPSPIQEVTLGSDAQSTEEPSKSSTKTPAKSSSSSKTSSSKDTTSECYNGAAYDAYSWSQSINDLDVIVRVPESVKKSKEVRVELKSDELEVAVLKPVEEAGGDVANKSWQSLVKGRFSFKIKNTQSYWCLEPGKHVSLHLDKTQERWWDALLDSEPRIELSKIDCTRNLEEMGESEQMKVEELMWNQKRKLLGQSTSDQMRMEQILQKAWNADGSPFKGTEYDPSVLKFN